MGPMICRTVLTLALAAGLPGSLYAADAGVPPTAVDAPAAESAPQGGEPSISLEDIQTFVAVFRAVKDAYVEPVDDKTLMQAAIRTANTSTRAASRSSTRRRPASTPGSGSRC